MREDAFTPNRPSFLPLYDTYWVPGSVRFVLPRSICLEQCVLVAAGS